MFLWGMTAKDGHHSYHRVLVFEFNSGRQLMITTTHVTDTPSKGRLVTVMHTYVCTADQQQLESDKHGGTVWQMYANFEGHEVGCLCKRQCSTAGSRHVVMYMSL